MLYLKLQKIYNNYPRNLYRTPPPVGLCDDDDSFVCVSIAKQLPPLVTILHSFWFGVLTSVWSGYLP